MSGIHFLYVALFHFKPFVILTVQYSYNIGKYTLRKIFQVTFLIIFCTNNRLYLGIFCVHGILYFFDNQASF